DFFSDPEADERSSQHTSPPPAAPTPTSSSTTTRPRSAYRGAERLQKQLQPHPVLPRRIVKAQVEPGHVDDAGHVGRVHEVRDEGFEADITGWPRVTCAGVEPGVAGHDVAEDGVHVAVRVITFTVEVSHVLLGLRLPRRSEEHTSELQSR